MFVRSWWKMKTQPQGINPEMEAKLQKNMLSIERELKGGKLNMPRRDDDDEEYEDDLDEEDEEEVAPAPIVKKKSLPPLPRSDDKEIKEMVKAERKTEVQIQEVEVTLGLINQKINYIISLLSPQK